MYWLIVIAGLLENVTRGRSNIPLLSSSLRTFQVHACDGHDLKIECWPSTVVNIYLAQYGRQVPSHQLCPPGGVTEGSLDMLNDTTDCLSTHALRTFEGSCREQRMCKIQTSPETFGNDPCPGVRKYAEVAYKCRPNVFSNRVVCEGEQLRLRCNRAFRIVIYSASFGATRSGIPECPQPEGEVKIEDCQVNYATEAVISNCHGRRRCSIVADIGTFGNPGCPSGTRHFLKVVHTCVPMEILKDPDMRTSSDDLEGENGFVEETRYLATVQPPLVRLSSTLQPPLVDEGVTNEFATTVKTAMQSDEDSDQKSSSSFKDNKPIIIMCLIIIFGVLLVAFSAFFLAKFVRRRSRLLHELETEASKKSSLIVSPQECSGGGISPFAPSDCIDLEHFDQTPRDCGVDVVIFSPRSSFKKALPIDEEEFSYPKASVTSRNNYFYS